MANRSAIHRPPERPIAAGPPAPPPVEPDSDRPDVVMQIRYPLADGPPCFSTQDRADIAETLRQAFASGSDGYPDTYVDGGCVEVGTSNEAAAFGVWTAGPAQPPPEVVAQRHALLDAGIGRSPGEHIAFFVRLDFLQRVGDKSLAAAKAANSGQPRLDALTLEVSGTDTLVTVISGVNEDATPDVSFTLRIADTFTGGPSEPLPGDSIGTWVESKETVDTDTGVLDALTGLATIALGLSPLLAFVAAPLWYEVYEADTTQPPEQQGVGRGVATQLLPSNIPRKGGTKIPIRYTLSSLHHVVDGIGVAVDHSGMYFGGGFELPVPRVPAVTLAGPSEVSVHIGGADVSTTTRALTYDLRGALTFQWTVNGHAHPAGREMQLDFNPSAGPFGTQRLAVSVVDEDGLTASASTAIVVSKQEHHGPGTGSGNPIHPA